MEGRGGWGWGFFEEIDFSAFLGLFSERVVEREGRRRGKEVYSQGFGNRISGEDERDRGWKGKSLRTDHFQRLKGFERGGARFNLEFFFFFFFQT